ncbi:MAG TPA: thioesterase family protein, partial [Acidimicrobiales bacterium]|nr:thioesterase family protein [Acidimicrobiales bacterium]
TAMPDVQPPDPKRASHPALRKFAPPFTKHLVIQPRIGPVPFRGSSEPMVVGAWLGLLDPDRPLDALVLALFSDSLYSPPFIKLDGPGTSPTVDLTIHFRAHLGEDGMLGEGGVSLAPGELCLARFSTALVHEGFFEEDGLLWAPDGTLLAQSRQLAILMPLPG